MMTAGRGYLAALFGAAMIAAAIVAALPAGVRGEALWGVVLGLVVQAPLGWWTIRSIGAERFQLVWAIGMLIRLVVVFTAALFVVPALHWGMGPALGALAGTLAALLMVESVTALREQSGIKAR
jgi:hypothetical protein